MRPWTALAFLIACTSPAPAVPRRAPVIDVPCGGLAPPPSERPVALPPPSVPDPPAPPEGAFPRLGPEAPCVRSEHLFSGAYAIEAGRLYDGSPPSRVVVRGTATLRLSYPLRDDVRVPLHGPLRGEALLGAIREAYLAIYAEEDRVPGVHPYGIWGHDASDLFVESIDRCETQDGVEIRVGVGS